MNYFNKVKFKQLQTFIEILSEVQSREKDYLEALYRKKSENFVETIDFFVGLELLEIDQNSVVCSNSFSKFLKHLLNNQNSEEKIKDFIIYSIFESYRVYSYTFFEYINMFECTDNKFVYKPLRKENLKYSGIRNLLMELNILEFDVNEGKYFLKKEILNLFQQSSKLLSPTIFEKMQNDKRELGELAEILVFEEEKKRFSTFPELADHVRHTSKLIVNAGYDIESFEEIRGNNIPPQKIFIEVKAINLISPRFYWSINEIKKAKDLQGKYWLYLVPYHDNRKFDISLIEKISDPYKLLFVNNQDWKSQVELYSFTKISNLGKH